MAQLMLLNPAKRRRRTATKRRASPAQLRALAKGRASRKRRTRAPVAYMAANPRRRRRSAMRATPHHRRRVRRNPIGGSVGLMGMVTGAAVGAAGALAVDAVVSYLIPASMAGTLLTGNMKYLTKGALAIGLGMIGRKVLGSAAGRMAQGALTVQVYAMARDMIGPSMTGMTFSGLGYAGPAQVSMPRRLASPGVAEYLNQPSGMAEYVPTSHY
jgi:hypothetical protein